MNKESLINIIESVRLILFVIFVLIYAFITLSIYKFIVMNLQMNSIFRIILMTSLFSIGTDRAFKRAAKLTRKLLT
jgi:hypothetical protein